MLNSVAAVCPAIPSLPSIAETVLVKVIIPRTTLFLSFTSDCPIQYFEQLSKSRRDWIFLLNWHSLEPGKTVLSLSKIFPDFVS